MLAPIPDTIDHGIAGARPWPPCAGFLVATIDDRRWQAAESLQVACWRGLLAVAGVDRTGTVLTLAVDMDQGPGVQLIGTTAANAALMIGRDSWIATSTAGSGWIRLSSLGTRRAAGTFEVIVERPGAPGDPPARTVRDGRFAVAF